MSGPIDPDNQSEAWRRMIGKALAEGLGQDGRLVRVYHFPVGRPDIPGVIVSPAVVGGDFLEQQDERATFCAHQARYDVMLCSGNPTTPEAWELLEHWAMRLQGALRGVTGDDLWTPHMGVPELVSVSSFENLEVGAASTLGCFASVLCNIHLEGT